MTEDDFSREEQAFAQSLRASADAQGFRPLDPDAVRAAAPTTGAQLTSGWFKGLAAAAALVVVVGAGALVLPRLTASSSADSVPAAPEMAGGNAPVPEATAADGENTMTAASERGAQWQEFADVPLTPRSSASGQWLDGRFYLVGGQLDQPCPANASCVPPTRLLADGASFDPATGSWRPIAEAPVPIAGGAPVAVGGKLYFQLGQAGASSVYAYDPAADAWAKVASPRGGGSLVALGDRLGSFAFSTEEDGYFDELYDPATGRWTRLPDAPGSGYARQAFRVGDSVLLASRPIPSLGPAGPPLVRLAEFDLARRAWRELPVGEVVGGGAVAVGGLVVFPEPGTADGGEAEDWGRAYPLGGSYDPAARTWRELPPRPDGWGAGVTTAWNAAAVAGGRVLAGGHLLDPGAGTWTELSSPPGGNLEGQTVVAGPDGLLVFGGWDGDAPTARATYLPLR